MKGAEGQRGLMGVEGERGGQRGTAVSPSSPCFLPPFPRPRPVDPSFLIPHNHTFLHTLLMSSARPSSSMLSSSVPSGLTHRVRICGHVGMGRE